MKRTTTLLLSAFILATSLLSFSSCNKDDKNPKPVPREKKYELNAYGALDIKGNAVFKEILNTDSIKITITLKGQDIGATSSLPIKIRKGTSIEDGEVLLNLGDYNGSENKMVKKIKLPFDDLLTSNLSLGVYNPNTNEIVSQAEIGANATFKSFAMVDPNSKKKNGQFRIYQREEGAYLVIKLDQDKISENCQGSNHPAGLYNKSGFPDENITIDAVADSNGVSATKLTKQKYKEFIKYQGKIKILCSKEFPDVTISVGEFK